jgi:transcription elongation GreA/GreB family factor
MTTSEPTWLTQAAYDRYAEELEFLTTTRRVEIAKEIQTSRRTPATTPRRMSRGRSSRASSSSRRS